MKLVTTEAVMTALCQHCDSHIEMCDDCGMKEILSSVPSPWISVKDRQQAERTAWRNIRDWVLAQLALVESCDVPMDQVFLPYLADVNGKTLYDAYTAGQLLPGGMEEQA